MISRAILLAALTACVSGANAQQNLINMANARADELATKWQDCSDNLIGVYWQSVYEVEFNDPPAYLVEQHETLQATCVKGLKDLGLEYDDDAQDWVNIRRETGSEGSDAYGVLWFQEVAESHRNSCNNATNRGQVVFHWGRTVSYVKAGLAGQTDGIATFESAFLLQGETEAPAVSWARCELLYEELAETISTLTD